MNKVLVDSSVWISYFKDKSAHMELDDLLLNNQVCTNNLILSELLPSLRIRNQVRIAESFIEIENVELNINWDMIIHMQTVNYSIGINGVGIPDLIILDNALHHNLILFSEDRHFQMMQQHTNLKLFGQ